MTTVRMFVTYRVLLISDQKEHETDFSGTRELLNTDPTVGGYIRTGVNYGRVEVTVRPLDSEPSPDGDEWEETEEVTMVSTHGDLIVAPFYFGEDEEPTPSLASRGIGRYRVRCSAIGRSIAPDDTLQESEERYLISSWPIDPPDEYLPRRTAIQMDEEDDAELLVSDPEAYAIGQALRRR